jgi:putative membrane protein insertion efficiency factor
MLGVIRSYQLVLSPLLGGGVCRFYPSCSEYAAAVIARDGPLRGGWKAVRRLSRCTPLQTGGVDLP